MRQQTNRLLDQQTDTDRSGGCWQASSVIRMDEFRAR